MNHIWNNLKSNGSCEHGGATRRGARTGGDIDVVVDFTLPLKLTLTVMLAAAVAMKLQLMMAVTLPETKQVTIIFSIV